MKVLAVETRVRAVALLKGRALCVNALARRLGITPGAASQHLRVLRDADLVRDERRGYFVHYRTNPEALAAWREQINHLLDPDGGSGANTKGAPTCTARRRKAAGNLRS